MRSPLPIALLAACVLCVTSRAGADPTPARAVQPFIRGLALGQYSELRDPELTAKLNELRWLGVSHVSLVVSWSTRDIHSSSIEPLPGLTTPDPTVLRMASRARSLGLRVFLFPILDVQNRKAQEWRGALAPKSWDEWWRSYDRFILHFARLAAQSEAEMFCVGSELVSTEKMRERWRSLIQRVRRVYSGKLVYSANWDHYTPVTFWDLVDVAGLTAYYKLAEQPGADEDRMVAAWREPRRRLIDWSRRSGRPFIFTEVGYPSIAGCAVAPWDYTRPGATSLTEQERAYRAFIRTWAGTRQLAGVFFWDWYGDGGQEDRRYTPRGKPAARLIRSWYLGADR